MVAGVDEVGRGALAGPVSVGVVALGSCDAWPRGLADSKELSPRARERLAVELAAYGLARAIGSATNDEIDALGMIAALRLAGQRALARLAVASVVVDAILLDGSHDWLTPPTGDLFGPDAPSRATPRVVTVVKGDGACVSIAAASVLAKVERDAVMVAAHDDHPQYGWAGNKGYGSAGHLKALERYGPTPWHRVSWNIPGGGRARGAVGA